MVNTVNPYVFEFQFSNNVHALFSYLYTIENFKNKL